MLIFFSGFLISLSLIVVIGAQNAFVLKQGIKKQHVLAICLVCACSDAILMSIGVFGFGAIFQEYPLVIEIIRYLGAAFLAYYAFLSFRAVFSNHSLSLNNNAETSLKKTLLICLAFTWLNPQVYLDTIVILGSIANQYDSSKELFAIGAISASFIFFFSLGYGSILLAKYFKKPIVWKYLDFCIGLIMSAMALFLLLDS